MRVYPLEDFQRMIFVTTHPDSSGGFGYRTARGPGQSLQFLEWNHTGYGRSRPAPRARHPQGYVAPRTNYRCQKSHVYLVATLRLGLLAFAASAIRLAF